MVRYETVFQCEAEERGFPDPDGCDDYGLIVYRFEDGKEPERVGSDSSEPEDATLSRSFNWVISELTRCAKEINELREKGGAS